MDKNKSYNPLTAKLTLQLMAPHTWPAAIIPVMVGTALAIHRLSLYERYPAVPFLLVFVLLLIVVLMQSSVNTLNDYADFKKGADTKENQMDSSDAVLVFNNVNPSHVKWFGIALLALAAVLGCYVIYIAGWVPLAYGMVGAIILVLYSGGKLPISYMPIGELVSGFTMGTLVMMAVYYTLTDHFDLFMFVYSLPVLIGIGLILMTNNSCDIEKDIQAHRSTLPVLLGREGARKLYHQAFFVWIIIICVLGCTVFSGGALLIPFMLAAIYPFGKTLCANPLVLESRVAAMSQILTVNVVLGAFYVAIVLMDALCPILAFI